MSRLPPPATGGRELTEISWPIPSPLKKLLAKPRSIECAT
jgi:hypothetical protein